MGQWRIRWMWSLGEGKGVFQAVLEILCKSRMCKWAISVLPRKLELVVNKLWMSHYQKPATSGISDKALEAEITLRAMTYPIINTSFGANCYLVRKNPFTSGVIHYYRQFSYQQTANSLLLLIVLWKLCTFLGQFLQIQDYSSYILRSPSQILLWCRLGGYQLIHIRNPCKLWTSPYIQPSCCVKRSSACIYQTCTTLVCRDDWKTSTVIGLHIPKLYIYCK